MKKVDSPIQPFLPWRLFPNAIAIALALCFCGAMGPQVASAQTKSGPDYQYINQMLDGYPLLLNRQGKPVLLSKPAEPKPVRLDPEIQKHYNDMRQYGYLSYLVESGQFDEARRIFGARPDNASLPLGFALLEARMLLAQKEFDATLPKLKGILAQHADNVDAALLLAALYQEQDKPQEAIAILEQARKSAPRNAKILEQLGKLYAASLKKATTQAERSKALENMESTYDTIVQVLTGRPVVPFLYSLAYIKQERQKIPEAIELLTRVVQIDPRRPDVRLLLAQLHRAAGEKDKALETLEKAFLFDPNQPEIAQALDQAIRENGKSPADYYKALAEEYPGRDPIQIQYARILVTGGNTAEAIRVLRATLDLHPQNDIAWLLLAGVYGQDGKLEESRKALKSFLEYAPDPGMALAKSSGLLLAFGQTDEALGLIERLRQIEPNHPELAELSVQANLAKGDYEKALPALQEAIRAEPGNLDRYPLLVRVLSRLNRLKEAVEPLEKARTLAKGPAWNALTAQLAQIHRRTGQAQQAEALLREGMAKDPKNPEWPLELARLHQVRKEPDKARAALKPLLDTKPSDPGILHDLGALLWELGSHKEGEELIRRAIALDPRTGDYYNTLGYLFSEQKIRLDEALELVEKALQLSPGQGYIIDSLGWVYFQKGEFEKAVKALEEAAQKEAGDPTVQSHLGQAYLKAGRKEDALNMFKSALVNSEDAEESAWLRKEIEKLEKR